jgi:tetratricopeptide (TPR) repeat protein
VKRYAGFTLLVVLAVLPLATVGLAQTTENKNLEKKKAIAQSEHELLALYIEQGEFAKVPEGLQKILDQQFTGKYERYVVDEIVILSDLLLKKGQAQMALKLADMGLARLSEKDSQARLYKEKGFIYKQQNQADKAMEMFEKSRALESSLK